MLTLLGIFCAVTALELHLLVGGPGGVPAVSAQVAFHLLPAIIALWVTMDAQERGRRTSYDFGSWVFFLWPVMVPVYLFRTRGLQGLGLIGLFFAVIIAAGLFAEFMGYPTSLPR